MCETACINTRRVVWREMVEPKLGGPIEAPVHRVNAGRCDGDNLPIFHRVTTGLNAEMALHHFDPRQCPQEAGPADS